VRSVRLIKVKFAKNGLLNLGIRKIVSIDRSSSTGNVWSNCNQKRNSFRSGLVKVSILIKQFLKIHCFKMAIVYIWCCSYGVSTFAVSSGLVGALFVIFRQ